jgi:hypothetical protein
MPPQAPQGQAAPPGLAGLRGQDQQLLGPKAVSQPFVMLPSQSKKPGLHCCTLQLPPAHWTAATLARESADGHAFAHMPQCKGSIIELLSQLFTPHD